MILISSFQLGLTHSQITVFEPNLEPPFNDWSLQHYEQGFAWRPQSVAFRTLGSRCKLSVEVWLADEVHISSDVVRAILVPFSVSSTRTVAIQDVFSEPNSNIISIPENQYALIFETGYSGEYIDTPQRQGNVADHSSTWCRFSFVPQESAQPKILRADERLSPTYPLLMQADPA
jgi:hypothetical protein